MTSLIGMKAYTRPSKSKRIVLATDTQITTVDSNDVPVSKITGLTKISTGNYWAMSYTGTYTPPITAFFRKLRGKENSGLVEEAMKNKFFPEVQELTRKICRKYGQEDTVNFLLAVSKPELGLYFVDLAGNILERPPDDDGPEDYLVLGSGRDSVMGFLERKFGHRLNGEGITINTAVKFAYEAIEKCSDVSTGVPIELVIVRNNGVNKYGPRLKKAMEKAKKSELEAIIEEELRE